MVFNRNNRRFAPAGLMRRDVPRGFNLTQGAALWTPAELTGNRYFWNGSSLVTVTGSGVSAWEDEIQGFVWDQTTDSFRPSYVGGQYLDYDGVNHRLDATTAAFDCPDDGDWEAIFIHYPTWTAAVRGLMGPAGTQGISCQPREGGASRLLANDGVTTIRNGAAIVQNTLHAQRYSVLGAASPGNDTLSLWLDGVSSATTLVDKGPMPNPTASAAWNLGATGASRYQGRMYAVILAVGAGEAFTADELTLLTDWANRTYGMTLTGI